MRRNSAKVEVNGTPVIWLGANFWSRAGGPRMWTSYDRGLVRYELEVLARHGLRETRSFFYWPDFMPTPDRVDEAAAAHFADFLDAHSEAGMSTIPTFIIGHMSGENWDPPWRGGRDLYADVWMVGRQAWFAEEMTRRYRDHPAIAGWLISNEMPIYGRSFDEPAAPTDEVTAWAQLMIQAVRAGGGTQPVSTGDGAWGVEVTGEDNGYSVREIGALVDFIGPHVYRMENDPVRQHLNAAFICELAAVGGKPVVLEEFGLSTDFVSTENSATYYRQALHNTLLAGATGWIAWNNTDYDNLRHQDPYRHHPFEMHFGITTNDGTPKPPLLELADFGSALDEVDFAHCRRDDTDVALVVTSYLERGYPFTRPEDRQFAFGCLRQAYVAGREADVPMAFSREADGLAEDARLYVLPSIHQLTAPTWDQLRGLAERGAIVYASTSSGNHPFQRAAWHPDLKSLFGVEQQLVYGLNNPIDEDVVEMSFTADFGGIQAGEVLAFRAGGNEHSRSFLPVEPGEAQVVAVDGQGRPALLRHRVGQGEMVLGTYPVEHFAASLGHVNPEPTYRIYDALARIAGVQRYVVVDDPRVFSDTLVHEDGRRFAWFVSQADEELVVTPQVSGRLAHRTSGEPVGDKVTLPPYGVEILQLIDDGTQ